MAVRENGGLADWRRTMDGYAFEEAETWKRARELAWEVYGLTSKSNFGDDFRLKNSIRRASFAVMANVAEGFERSGKSDFLRYLAEAREEIQDLCHWINVAHQNDYIKQDAVKRIEILSEDLGCMISGLMTYVRQSEIVVDTVSSDKLQEA